MIFTLVFAVSFAFLSCASLQQQNTSVSHSPEQAAYPAGSGLVFIGVSPRYSSRDESIKNALNDAARRLSFFYSVTGYSASRQHVGATNLDIYFNFDYHLSYDDDLDKYLEMLKYNLSTDIFESNNAVFITTNVPSDISMPVFRGHSAARARPEWINSPPSQIDGRFAGVGFSTRYSSHSDTVKKSYENAVIAIIESMEVSVRGSHYLFQDGSFFGFEAASSGGSRASGTLENFYVIESWTDTTNLSVWTLAVAGKKPQ